MASEETNFGAERARRRSPRSDPAAPGCMTTTGVNRATWLASTSEQTMNAFEAVAIAGREDYEMAVFPPTTSFKASSSTACRQVAPVYIYCCTRPHCREWVRSGSFLDPDQILPTVCLYQTRKRRRVGRWARQKMSYRWRGSNQKEVSKTIW